MDIYSGLSQYNCVKELEEDLRKKLDCLNSLRHSPSFCVSEYFHNLRNTIDIDAETLLTEYELEDDEMRADQVTETRDKFFRILKELQDAMLKKLSAFEMPQSRREAIESLEKRYERFKESLSQEVDISDIEDAYVQLAVDLIDECDRLLCRLFSNQSIVYRRDQHLEGKRLGLLIYFPDDFLTFTQSCCVQLCNMQMFGLDDVYHALVNIRNRLLLVKFQEPFVLSKNHVLVYRLGKYLTAFKDSLHSKFLFFSKSREQCFGYSAKDSNIFLYTPEVTYNMRNVCVEGVLNDQSIYSLAPNECVFDYFQLKNSRLCFPGMRFQSLDPALTPFLQGLKELSFEESSFESANLDLLATCKQLTSLKLIGNRFPDNNYNLGFLTSLTGLESLSLTLPDSEWDFEFFERFDYLTELRLETALDTRNKRLSRKHLVQISAARFLDTLELAYFEIESIDQQVMRGFRELFALELNHNRIVHLDENAFKNAMPQLASSTWYMNEMPSLQIDLFSSAISTLEINNSNMIQTINQESFKKLMYLSILTLASNCINELPVGVFDSLVNLEMLELYTNLSRIIRGTFDRLVCLKTLDLAENPIETIEAGAFSCLKNLESLYLNGCRLRTINDQMFCGLENLWSLDLGNNPIETIGANSFSFLSKLNRINLEACRLKSIDNLMFNGLTGLQCLNISNNLIASIDVLDESSQSVVSFKANLTPDELEYVKKLFFKDLTILRDFDLSDNKLQKLDLNYFYNLRQLYMIKLGSNMIDELNSQAQPGLLPSLRVLDLKNNQLTRIDKDAFSTSSQLSSLILAKNKLEWLNDEFFAPFANMSHLNLSENALEMTVTQSTFVSCGHGLKTLNFWGNPSIRILNGALDCISYLVTIKYQSPSSLQLQHLNKHQSVKSNPEDLRSFFEGTRSFRVLKKLALTSSSITSLTLDNENRPGAFNVNWLNSSQESLQSLDLSGNIIESLSESNLFSSFLHLRSINLSNNSLSYINSRSFNELLNLKYLDLSKNRLASIDNATFRKLPQLCEINLSSNELSFLDLPRLFQSCKCISALNLANNQLDNQSINEESIHGLIGLKLLNLNNNRLEDISFVRTLTRLTKLDLRDNKISSLECNDSDLFSSLSLLAELDLSGNCIRRFREDIFHRPMPSRSRFTFIDLSRNPLEIDSVLCELL